MVCDSPTVQLNDVSLNAYGRANTAEQLPTTSTASEASSTHRLPENHPDKEPIRRLIAAKRRALVVMAKRADGQDPDDALCEALEDARRTQTADQTTGKRTVNGKKKELEESEHYSHEFGMEVARLLSAHLSPMDLKAFERLNHASIA